VVALGAGRNIAKLAIKSLGINPIWFQFKPKKLLNN